MRQPVGSLQLATRRLQERATESTADDVTTAPATDSDTSASGAPSTPQAAEASPDNTPPLLKLNMTARQQRRLWHHVETIENFWGTLTELEPGVIPRLAALAAERRWEIIFLTKRPETAGATAQVQSQQWLDPPAFDPRAGLTASAKTTAVRRIAFAKATTNPPKL